MENDAFKQLSYLRGVDHPFDNTRDARYFYASSGHAEALARLVFLVEDRNMGIGLLTGEIGCGKTMTSNVFRNNLPSFKYKVVIIENCLLDFDGLLLEIISQIKGRRINADELPSRYSKLSAFKSALIEDVGKASKHLVLMLDEAQMLSADSLDQIRSLTNISSEKSNLFSVILIGQPELRALVKSMPQLDQRISLRFHLNPLHNEEISRYLLFRMRVAGISGAPRLTAQAVQIISRASRGIPREINRICKLSLDHAVAHKLAKLDSNVVALVVADLNLQGTLDFFDEDYHG